MSVFNADMAMSPENNFTGMKYDSKHFREDKIAVRSNYNIREAYARWESMFPVEKRLPGTSHRGCGINALVFLAEMSPKHAIQNVIDANWIGNQGTPIEEMVEWLNQKAQKVSPRKRLLFYEFTYSLVNPEEVSFMHAPMIRDRIKERLLDFYKMVFDDMDPDSIMLLKYERDVTELVCKGVNLTPGHTAVIGKCMNDASKMSLYFADPQGLVAPREMSMDSVSDRGFDALFINNYYRGISVVRAANADCSSLVNMILYLTPLNKDTKLLHSAAKFLDSNRQDLLASPKGFIDESTPKSKSKSISRRRSAMLGGNKSKIVDITSYLKDMPRPKNAVICEINNVAVANNVARKTVRKSKSRAHM